MMTMLRKDKVLSKSKVTMIVLDLGMDKDKDKDQAPQPQDWLLVANSEVGNLMLSHLF